MKCCECQGPPAPQGLMRGRFYFCSEKCLNDNRDRMAEDNINRSGEPDDGDEA